MHIYTHLEWPKANDLNTTNKKTLKKNNYSHGNWNNSIVFNKSLTYTDINAFYVQDTEKFNIIVGIFFKSPLL